VNIKGITELMHFAIIAHIRPRNVCWFYFFGEKNNDGKIYKHKVYHLMYL